MPDLETTFATLVRFQIELWNAVDARLRADHDVSLASFEPMRAIAGRGSCRVNDVADELVITVGGASKIVDRLEAAGLCTRGPNPDDRRSSLITLTAAGATALDAATATYRDELRRHLLEPLGDAALGALSDSLAILRSSIGGTTATASERTTP